MKYAIDRYGVGTEIEVSAEEFDNSYIPRRTSRFFCPECGEPVFWRAAGGSHCCHFCHKVKTARSPECDKRVDGRSGLSLYERVGLPIFLSHIGVSFQLSVGFPALGSELLGIAEEKNVTLYIKAGTYERSAKVTQSTFSENTITLIPINFIPSYAANYSINLCASSSVYKIQHRWSDYADGFDYGGAIFLMDEVNSKKVRRGDNISPGKKYYVVSKNFSPSYPEIIYKRVGSIQLNNSAYDVYCIEIDVSSKNETRFTLISNYFKRLFNVWLLETVPEIIPLWPPCALQNDYVPVTVGKVHCAISSGNASPHVYSYNQSSVSSMAVTFQSGNATIEIPPYSLQTTLSVDRKYVGREITIARRPVVKSDYGYQIVFERKDLSVIEVTKLRESDLASEFFISSNSKFELYVNGKNQTYQHLAIRDSKTLIPPRNDSMGIILVIEGAIFKQYKTEQSIKNVHFDESIFNAELLQHTKGTMVQAPRWVIYFSNRCRKMGYFEISATIQQLIVKGKIAIGALQFIYSHQKDIMFEKV